MIVKAHGLAPGNPHNLGEDLWQVELYVEYPSGQTGIARVPLFKEDLDLIQGHFRGSKGMIPVELDIDGAFHKDG